MKDELRSLTEGSLTLHEIWGEASKERGEDKNFKGMYTDEDRDDIEREKGERDC